MTETNGKPPAAHQDISTFFEKMRKDPILQGKMNLALAASAPEKVAEIAKSAGFTFSPDDLSSVVKQRDMTASHQDLFQRIFVHQVNDVDDPFVQIKGPTWVQNEPYRPSASPVTHPSTAGGTAPETIVDRYQRISKA